MSRRAALLFACCVAKSSSWYTGGGYASSAVDVYVSGGSTEMFGSVSSGGGSSSPAPPVTKTCANRNAACEWVPSWDSDGLYCSSSDGGCVDLCASSLDASACDAARGLDASDELRDWPAVLQLLLASEASRRMLDAADEHGRTALLFAAVGSAACVQALLDAGADCSLRNLEGLTAQSEARAEKQDECERLLARAWEQQPAQQQIEQQRQQLAAADVATRR